MTESSHDVVAGHAARLSNILAAVGEPFLVEYGAIAPSESVPVGRFDNQPTWDNWSNQPGPTRFDNRPTWDNWSNR